MRPYLPLILWVLLGCLAVFVGPYLFKEQGYFLFSYGKYYIEATMFSVILVLIGLWFVERVLMVLVRKIAGTTRATRFYFFSKSEGKAKLALHQGLTAFLLKDWARAEKLISVSGKRSGLLESKPMFAAIAADAMGDEDKVLAHLATLEGSDADTVILKADLLLRQDEVEQAYQLVKPLYDKKAKDQTVFSLYVRILRERQDWEALLDLMPKIEKFGLYSESQQLEFATMVVESALSETARTQTIEAVEQQFKQMPGKLKKQNFAVAAYIAVLANNGDAGQAEKLLLKALKKGEIGDYLALFRKLKLSQPIELNHYLQAELKKNENDPQLLAALGHLAFGCGDHSLAAKALGKAAEYLRDEADLKVLASAYAQAGQHAEAVAVYQKLYIQ